MRVPDPKANTTTEAYLAYKAGYLEESELKPVLYEPYLHFDAWLAYWAGLTNEYPLDKNGEPEMLTDEEALVAYLAGVTDTYPEEIKDPYDVRIVGYLRHLASIRWPEPDYPVNNEEFYLSTMEPTHTSNPEPSSDIELDTAEGKIISVEAYGDTYQQTYSGKNLFDGIYVNYAIGGNSGYQWFTANNTRSAIVKCQPNTTYAIKKYEPSSNRFSIADYPSMPSDNTELNGLATDSSATQLTVTTHSDAQYMFIYVSNDSVEPQMQVEEGSTATSYEPYTGGIPAPSPSYPMPISVVTGAQTVTISDGGGQSETFTVDLGSLELCKIGDYQDYIYNNEEDWYVHKAITKAIFNGTENWALHNAQNNINGFRLDANAAHSDGAIVANSYRKVPMSEYSYNRGYYMATTLETGATGSNYRIYMTQPNSSVITLEDFTTWLGTNNVTAYYASQTPTDTKITDGTLVGQLEALAGADTYNEKTFIKVTATDPNLPALLKVEAYKY